MIKSVLLPTTDGKLILGVDINWNIPGYFRGEAFDYFLYDDNQTTIKSNDYGYDFKNNLVFKLNNPPLLRYAYKIIATTNKTLVENGVKSIDNTGVRYLLKLGNHIEYFFSIIEHENYIEIVQPKRMPGNYWVQIDNSNWVIATFQIHPNYGTYFELVGSYNKYKESDFISVDENPVRDNNKYVWINPSDGTFSDSWLQHEHDSLVDEKVINISAKAGSKLIQYQCLTDDKFEFNINMKLR